MKFLSLLLCNLLFFCAGFSQVYENEQMKQTATEEIEKKLREQPIVDVISIPNEEMTPIFCAEVLCVGYKLETLKAVDLNSNHKEEVIQSFQKELNSELDTKDIYFSIDLTKMYFVSKTDLRRFSVKEIQVENGVISYINCEKCNGNQFLVLVHSNDELILQAPSEDFAKPLFINYTFKKTKL